ncbi:permease [Gemmatirosa kalamazoonensis]|uniref:Permease n=1 Tax=Gemmatirosa kalamazoonensis TaxID=861299 RepID=W0RAQ9_9BACT|nr:ADOP family duplicated permease [Gemmatirosa kalamazoonensis]AHG87871.1 permease [Gemmatirosa kalamazoonensis]
MPNIPGLRRFFRLATRRTDVARDVDAELAFHFEMTAAELERRGLSPQAARDEARRRFGDVDARRAELRRIDERHDRARRSTEWLQGLASDVRLGARTLRRSPGFAAVVVVTLALGIGANAMMFGIVDRLLLRPPAYLRDAGRTGRIFFTRTLDGSTDTYDNVGYAFLRDIREGTRGAVDVVGVSTGEGIVGDGVSARTAHVGMASGELWSLFDARPALGRFFGPQDDRLPVGAPAAVLGYEYWRRELGGDPSVLGRPLRVGGGTFTVVGVAPKGFTGVGLRLVDVWVPLTAGSASSIGAEFASRYNMSWFELVAMRRAGVSETRANALLTRAYVESLRRRIAVQPTARIAHVPLASLQPKAAMYSVLLDRGPKATDGARVAVWVAGVALIVLLVACANVANLLLARAVGREREVAVRVALGVGRARLTRQLLTEVALLAALGAVAGLLLARVGGAFVTRVLIPDIAFGDALADGRTLAVTAAIAMAAGLLASLAPSLRALRPDLVTRLRGGAREGGERHGRTRAALVLAQASLSAVLLVGAGLFVRSLRNAHAVDFGFEPARVLYASVQLRGERLDSVRTATLYARLAERAGELRDVETVGTTFELPYYRGFTTDRVRVPGRDSVTGNAEVHGNTVGLDYFRAMGTRVLRGRVWDPRTPAADTDAVVLSAALAKLVFGTDDVVGRCVIVAENDPAPCRPIIGVVADVRRGDPRQPGVPGFYVPRPEVPRWFDMSGLVIRTRGDAAQQMLAVQRALQPLAPGAAYVSVHAMADLVAPELRPWMVGATLFSAFGALGLLVAVVGLYSVLAYDVAQRRRDIGVRLALGARAGDVLRLVVRRGVAFAAVGVATGVALALAAGRAMGALLFGVSPHDPTTIGVVAVVLVAAAVAASLVPGYRAARIDPATSLKGE